MEQKLKVTNALSDPTRFNIYQYIIKSTNAATVNEVAKEFDIHPNVARMHLSKLEDVELIISYTKKQEKVEDQVGYTNLLMISLNLTSRTEITNYSLPLH